MTYRSLLFALCAVLLNMTAFMPLPVHSQEYNALKECIEQSPLIDDIHLCMDDYLDLMDGSLDNITGYIADSLDEEARLGLERSQQAFDEYRRQNCLWYLEFSSPRSEAEQIAKNCLASMSQQRLRELQALLRTDEGDRQIVNGFYVYGSERNSFQPCGSQSRYWVEGNNSEVGRLQQEYLTLASSDLQLMFVSVAGQVAEGVQAPLDHQGIFELTSLVDLRVPTESDCSLPASNLRIDDTAEALVSPPAEQSAEQEQEAPGDELDVEEQLVGYFGDWVVDCTAMGGVRGCRLEGSLAAGSQGEEADLSLIRRAGQLSSLEAFFSGQEIDSPARIRWSVDAMLYGDIVGSEIRVDQSGTRLLVPSSEFLSDEVIPMMMRGDLVELEVLAAVDDDSGERYTGSLLGVTGALGFADDFIRGDGL